MEKPNVVERTGASRKSIVVFFESNRRYDRRQAQPSLPMVALVWTSPVRLALQCRLQCGVSACFVLNGGGSALTLRVVVKRHGA